MSKLNGKWIQDASVDYDKLIINDGDLSIAKTSGLQTALDGKIPSSEKGAADGVAPLNSSSKIDAIYLPSYVDDVLEYANLAAFPGTGEQGKIYVALDTNKTYRWSGSAYVEVSPNDVNSVNGQTGIVVLDADDISDASTTNKFATAAEKTKLGFISVTQAVDLDDMESDIATLQGASHSHSNLVLLETYTQSEADLADAVAKKHSHANQSVLDATTASFTTADETKLDFISVTQAVDLDAMESAIAAVKQDKREIFTLVAQDITNGYIDLAQSPVADSVQVSVDGLIQLHGTDYTLATNRITFAGDMASLLTSGDGIVVQYRY